MGKDVRDIDHARLVARQYARDEGFNEARAEAYADVWYEAGKDSDASTEDDLRVHLRRRFATSE